MDLIKADDVTVTLVRETKPEGLFRYFTNYNYTVLKPYQGIYYIKGIVLFPTQIIVTKELEWKIHIWLRSLSEEMKKQRSICKISHEKQPDEQMIKLSDTYTNLSLR